MNAQPFAAGATALTGGGLSSNVERRMNPRRVHELLRKHFPPIEHTTREWKLVPDERDAQLTMLSALLSTYISAQEVVIEVHRKLGTFISLDEAPSFIALHIGQGEIRIADRAFTSFVVVGINGVATGWHALANNSSQPSDDGGD